MANNGVTAELPPRKLDADASINCSLDGESDELVDSGDLGRGYVDGSVRPSMHTAGQTEACRPTDGVVVAPAPCDVVVPSLEAVAECTHA